MCVDPNWLPLEKIEDGKYIGLGSEYMKYLENGIGIPITLVPTKSWSESLSNAKNRVCDILAMAEKTPSRAKYLHFTKPYINVPIVVATKFGVPFVEDIGQILDKKLGVVEDYSFYEKLKDSYPSIRLVPVASAADGMQKVKKGEIYGYLDNHIVINTMIQEQYMGIISISGKLKQNIELSIASRNDEQILGEILDHFLLTVKPLTKQNLYKKWITYSYKEKVDYTLLFWTLFVVFVILIGTLYWNRRLKVEIRRRRRAEEEIKIVNNTLESKVEEAVEEIHNKEILLQHQTRLAQMGEMLGMIAHQWRQPLSAVSAAIFGMESKLVLKRFDLQESKDREKFEKYLQSNFAFIQEHTQTMSYTIDDFRNFFKDETDQELTTVNEVTQKALEMIRPLLEKQEISITEKLESRHPTTLYRNEVMQVILNLLKNAQDALIDNNILERKITLHAYDTQDYATIKICDNAGGIEPDIVSKIFDPYFSTKLEQNGTGLGLYMSKMIIEDHHQGLIVLESVKDGSCFVLSFPRRCEPPKNKYTHRVSLK